jgi:hypothetical protein
MTGQERQDLAVAIQLIGDLRSETQDGMASLRTEMQDGMRTLSAALSAMATGQAAHLAVHAERDLAGDRSDKKHAEAAVTRRWVLGVVFTAVTIIIAVFGLAVNAVRLFI